MDLITIAYILNFILLGIASYTDIKTREIPHTIVILMLIINLPIGYYLYGMDSILAFFTTLILCLILGIGMGGGDIKIFTALAPIFSYGESIFYIPKAILLLIGISATIAAFYPMLNILKKYWKSIIPSAVGLSVLFDSLRYIFTKYNIPYSSLFLWAYIIFSIFLSRKMPQYSEIIKKLSYLSPIYLIGIYLIDNNYFVNNNVLLSFVIKVVELTLISLVIYGLTGAEISLKKPIPDLKEGDILRDIIYIKNGNVEVECGNIWKRFKLMVNMELGKKGEYDKIIITEGEGLSNEDLKLIEKLYKEGKMPVSELTLITTYPFVPFVLVGYVIVLFIHYYLKII